jgi:hypothetical protein
MYPQTVSDILIFKTNVIEETDVRVIAPILDSNERVQQWNIDREDVDHVLRVQTDSLETEDVIRIINSAGYACEELTD